jgi:3-deoxy-D-manno-octulosonic-acid transferase
MNERKTAGRDIMEKIAGTGAKMPLTRAVDACARLGYEAFSELGSCAEVLAHAAFFRRGEWWLSDLISDPKEVSRLKNCLLIYAPAAGEVLTSLPLIRLLRERRPDLPLLVCATTSSGLASARSAGLDSARLVSVSRRYCGKLIRALEPKGMLVIQVAHAAGMPVNLITTLADNQLPVIIANGYVPAVDFKVSTRVAYRCFDGVYDKISAYCMQTAEDVTRVISLGAAPDRALTAGNMKFDAALQSVSDQDSETIASELGLTAEDPAIVAGSTHSGEESMILDSFRSICRTYPKARLVIAPRDLTRIQSIVRLAESMGLSVVLRSSISSNAQVILLDTMGELRSFYTVAWIAFVGGTLAPIGGHNVLEPAALGKPVVFGPHTAHTSGAAEMLLEDGGGFLVTDGQTLAATLFELVQNTELRRTSGERARNAVESRSGAAERCVRIVDDLLLAPAEPINLESLLPPPLPQAGSRGVRE